MNAKLDAIDHWPIHNWQGWFAQYPAIKGDADLLSSVASELGLQVPSRAGFLTSEIASSIGLDSQALLAAAVVDQNVDDSKTGLSEAAVAVMDLVKGAQRVGQMSAYTRGGLGDSEAVRRMLIAMIDDVRVVVIQLATQLARLRDSKFLDDEERVALGRDTLELHAPLANRLGIWQLKWELEDLAFRCTNPPTYHDLAQRLEEKLVVRQQFIHNFTSELEGLLRSQGVRAEISGRPKHLYSIYKKMTRKGVDLEGIYDIRAVRILVDEIPQCYSALGVVHERWAFVSGEFDDYIATPKPNGYQSIHTAVVGPGGRIIEVQIRTHRMHEDNEYGVAAHWRYKEGTRQSAVDQKVRWLRQLLEWKDDGLDANSLFDQFKNDVIEDRVYVFTPDGDIIDLPEGSTPIDFAYAVHTQVGHRCRGAKINGRIVPLTHILRTGDQVAVLTTKTPAPGRDWLNVHLGFVKTSRAKARIQRWFKEQDYDSNLAAGRLSLEREFDRLGVRDVKYDTLAEQAGYKKVNDLLAAIGSGGIRMAQVVGRLRQVHQDQLRESSEPVDITRRSRNAEKGVASSVAGSGASGGSTAGQGNARGLRVQGVGNLLTTIASCCRPIPGDPISGYITRERGVTVHRSDCSNILRANSQHPEKLVLVDWGERDSTYPVKLLVRAFDRTSLIRDVLAVLSDARINVAGLNSSNDSDEHVVLIQLTIEITDLQSLSRTLALIQRVPNVFEVKRVSS